MNVISFLKFAESTLGQVAESPSLEARVLVARGIDRPASWVLAHPEAELSPEQLRAAETMLQKRAAGVPLPYVLGRWEFFNLEFIVSPDVLIPRPETELLVELAISHTRSKDTAREPFNILDVGTGSGCIAVSMAVNLPGVYITATDISPAALAIARQNAEKHGVADRIQFIECDLFPPENHSPFTNYHLLLSNPPYIPTATMKTLEIYGKEPTLALDGGPDGVETIRRLLEQATGRVNPHGMMLIELESSLGLAAKALAREHFPSAQIDIVKDLAGLDRILRIDTGEN
jgi:release factor glutamine methyltransferase